MRANPTNVQCKAIQKQPSLATPLTTGVGEDAGKKEPSYTVGGNVN
jgi:hypothetical protein